jgi:hypothetical protein
LSASEAARIPIASVERAEEGIQRLILSRGLARLDPVALGAAFGAVAGLGLFVATSVLLVRGGELVGYHLARLAYYLPFYSVSWGGACVGLIEAAAVGFGAGALLALGWNAYHRLFVAILRVREERRELQEL